MQISEQLLVEATSGREHFSPSVLGFQTAWDSTSLGSFKACPMKYLLEQVLSYKAREEATALGFGSIVHKGLEVFHSLLAVGCPREDALKAAIVSLLEEGKDWKPLDSEDNVRTLGAAVRVLTWYERNYTEDDGVSTYMLPNGKPATELSFRFPFFEAGGEPILLCGHFDRVVEFLGGVYVLDYKTSKSALSGFFFNRFSPDNQTGLYHLASSVVLPRPISGVIIEGIQLLVNGCRFQRHTIPRTKGMVDEVVDSAQYYIGQALHCARARSWPMNDKSCMMYSGCPFRDICSKDPAVRQNFLETSFIKRQWNPLTPR